MQKETFERLSVSQRIYKLVSLARESICSPGKQTFFWKYVSWVQQDSHPRLKKASELIDRYRDKLVLSSSHWYHLYHDLLALNNIHLSESDFLDPLFDHDEPLKRWDGVVLAHDVRSPFNVGSIIRTAEACGWKEVALSGISPSPTHPRVAKTSMNTHEWIPLRSFTSVMEALFFYQKQGYSCVALETAPQAVSLWQFLWPTKTLLVVGNEEFGIPEEVLPLVSAIITIPLYGRKRSLNVANAFAIVASVASQYYFSQEGKTEKPREKNSSPQLG